MPDTLTHIYKYPRVLTDVSTHIIDVWNLNIGGGGGSGEEGGIQYRKATTVYSADNYINYISTANLFQEEG